MNTTRRIASVLALAAVAVGVGASPALAHVGGGPAPSNWKSQVTSISPPMPGVRVRTVDNGDLVELVNHSDVTVTVLGYDGEPYLRISRTSGVEQNMHSAATYLNRTRDGRTTPPPLARDPQATPDWRLAAGTSTYRWHDHRTHWMLPDPPPVVQANPSAPHTVTHWTLQFRYGDTPVTVAGTLSWVPPPSPWPWYGLAVGLGALAGAVGWLPAARRPRLAAAATVTLLVLLVAGDVIHAVGEGLTAGSVVDVVTWAAGVLAAVLTVRRRQYAPLVTGLVGAVTAVVTGLGDLGMLTHSQLPFTGPGWLARACVADVLGVGVGLVVAAWRLSRPRAPSRSADQGRKPAEAPAVVSAGGAGGAAGTPDGPAG